MTAKRAILLFGLLLTAGAVTSCSQTLGPRPSMEQQGSGTNPNAEQQGSGTKPSLDEQQGSGTGHH